MNKINCALLVDDSKSTNFYNKKVIEVSGEIDHVFEVENGLEALDYIHQKGKFNATHPIPNIIFLDINMPKMNGFEFLKKYAELPKKKRSNTIVVILSTSNWQRDKIKAIESNLVYDFMEKPLKEDDFKKVSDYYQEKYIQKAS